MLYNLNLYSTVCQLYVSKTGKRKKESQPTNPNIIHGKSFVLVTKAMWS